MAKLGQIPAGALALSTLNRGTLVRKLGQLGVGEVARYARAKLIPHSGNGQALNPYLEPWLKLEGGMFRSLREVAHSTSFQLLSAMTKILLTRSRVSKSGRPT